MSKRNGIVKSFGYAGNGIKDAFKNEPNFKIHLGLAILSIILGFLLEFTSTEFAILIITITIVIVLELVNTVIEKIVDIISPEISQEAKIIKDLSAGIVLISAICATLVGALLFLPKITNFF